MLNKVIFLICTALMFESCRLQAEITPNQLSIRWLVNYDEALQVAKNSSKPMLLFFTGSDWCGWCTKLEDEALDTHEFAEAEGNKFIFVKVDFPLYNHQESSIKDQNQKLQKQFDVRSFPTIVLVDSNDEQQIGIVGYRPGGGKSLADHLNWMVHDYVSYKHKMSRLNHSKFSGKELKQLYEMSIVLKIKEDSKAIVSKGLHSDEKLYFLLERYRNLAGYGLVHSKEASAIRQQLLNADPNNEKLTQYQAALIEFEAYTEELGKGNSSPEYTTSPLVAYINKFGKSDKTNLWRIKMLISQVYLDKNQMSAALRYAEESYEEAPSCAQPEIGQAIKNIKIQNHS